MILDEGGTYDVLRASSRLLTHLPYFVEDGVLYAMHVKY